MGVTDFALSKWKVKTNANNKGNFPSFFFFVGLCEQRRLLMS